MKTLLMVLLVALILGGAGYLLRPNSELPLGTSPRNATYLIEGEPVTLVNGKAETPAAPGSASSVTTSYFGNEATGDLNADGRDDTGFILTQSGGGSGTFFYAATALAVDGGVQGTNAILLGDRVAPQPSEIRDGVFIVNYAERKPGEPMSARPSVGVSRYFVVTSGELAEQPR